jgi:hypothetical protein
MGWSRMAFFVVVHCSVVLKITVPSQDRTLQKDLVLLRGRNMVHDNPANATRQVGHQPHIPSV